MKKILVTGANGQLGHCLKDASVRYSNFEFFFASKERLDIADTGSIEELFLRNDFDYCINTAAYTNVEKAESEPEYAYEVNAEAVKNLSKACKEKNIVLVHVSTDYVFDGNKGTPYNEDDPTNPLNVYGASKLKGEEHIQSICDAYFIFRTSWLYSQYGHNFLNTILKFVRQKKNLTITTEQTGTPTNANDLATVILSVIDSNSVDYGMYHFSNEGEATWYDFSKEILRFSNQLNKVNLAKTDHYATFASRPKYSVLNTASIQRTFGTEILDWEESLKNVIHKLKN